MQFPLRSFCHAVCVADDNAGSRLFALVDVELFVGAGAPRSAFTPRTADTVRALADVSRFRRERVVPARSGI